MNIKVPFIIVVLFLMASCFQNIDKKELPNVLIIGDSISIDYTIPLAKILDGKANVVHISENAKHSRFGLQNLDKWLSKTTWEVIHFNHGLHDLKYVDIDGFNTRSKKIGHIQIPLKEYEKNMESLVIRLKESGSKLIFATTTPYPDDADGPLRDPGLAKLYNQAALIVMAKYGVKVNDLNALVSPQRKSLQLPKNVHFTPNGSNVLAQEVAKHIMKAIKSG